MKKYILLLLVAVAASAVTALAQIVLKERETIEYNRMKRQMEYRRVDTVEVILFNQAYACGECLPPYRIDAVLYSKDAEDRMAYMGKEIYLDIKNPEIQAQADVVNAPACYRYRLHGILHRNDYGLMRLEAVGGSIKRIWCEK